MMDRATFWKSLGAVVTIEKCRYYFAELDFLQVGQGDGKFDSWIDPADAEEVRLEVLLDGLERLAKCAYVAPQFIDRATRDVTTDNGQRIYCVLEPTDFERDRVLSTAYDRRTVIISAIERLITEAEE